MGERSTRTQILDAAEALFAERGFDGVSVRDVASGAGVRLGLATYYFETKLALFEAVIARRTQILNERRRTALEAMRLRPAWSVEDVLEAFVAPYLDLSLNGGHGWKAYGRLIAQLAQDNRWLGLIEHHMNETALLFRDALCQALPGVPPSTVARGFVFCISLIVSAFTENRRIEAMSDGVFAGSDLEGTFRDMIPFLAAGLRALSSGRPVDRRPP